MATKTSVTDGSSTVTGTIRVQNQFTHAVLISAPTKLISAQCGGVSVRIEDISTVGWSGPLPNPSPPAGPGVLTFAVYILSIAPNVIVAHHFVYLKNFVTDDFFERDFSFNITGRELWREESTSPSGSRDASPVYAKDVTETDSWQSLDEVTWTITFGGLSYSGTTLSPVILQPVTPIAGVGIVSTLHKGNAGVVYSRAFDMVWDSGSINLSRYEDPHPEPATGVYLDGKDGGVDVEVKSTGTHDANQVVFINRPFIVDFGSFGVWDRDGVLKSLVRIGGGFVANNHVPASLTWDNEKVTATVIGETVYPTVAQLRAVGVWVQTSGLVSGMEFRDPDDSHDLVSGASRSFSITESSAQEQLLDDTDLNIVLRVPPVNATTCYADTDWLGVYIMRRDNVGIYGPADALAHDDWTGSGGVPTASGAGAFTVTGDGDLTLTIPSGYRDRLDRVPLGTAPAGPPTIYMYHKADVWPGEPAEGAYDWRGFEQLNIPITAPEADTLTLLITYWTYVHNDNHLTDATRTTTYSYVATEHTQSFSLSVASGAQTIAVPIIAVDPYPVYEHVMSMALSGFANGAWVIGEPALPKAAVAQSLLKTFEYDYQHGGASGHHDAAYVWYDADEDNAGHDNRAELTVRNFDYRVGAVSGLDQTVAYTLEQYAGIIENVGEVFECNRNDTAYFAAVRDDEDPPNILTSAWSFNICYPNADNPDVNPLEQDIS